MWLIDEDQTVDAKSGQSGAVRPVFSADETRHMIIIALFVLLFTCWCFWGWCVGDSRNIRWIRHWCGGAFVIMVVLIASVGGFAVGQNRERSAARSSVFEALQVIADRIEAGDQRAVVSSIRDLDHRGDPDADAYDVLVELPQLVKTLRSDSDLVQRTAVEESSSTRQ